ncbi:hypothetical protein MMC22_002438 [Lobaria immixta]|nr:hypothetical protein [Lobaria immixta]
MQTLKWPFDKREIGCMIERLERFKQSISIILNHANLTLSQEIRGGGAKVTIKSIIDWLSPLNFLAKQQAIVKESRDGTGTWFLDSEIFTSWTSSEKYILWCPGIPGAGKTFLASIVADRLQKVYQSQNAVVLMIYCNYNDSSNQSTGDFIASLLKQIIQTQPILSGNIEELYQAHHRKGTRPTKGDLISILDSELLQYDSVFIIVDALDELLENLARLELIETLRDLKAKPKLMVTSRPVPFISCLFSSKRIICDGCDAGPCPSFYHCTICRDGDFDLCENCKAQGVLCQGQGHELIRTSAAFIISISAAEADVRNYIEWRISCQPSLRRCVAKRPGLGSEILDKVTEYAEGMFLLAKFHMDCLATKLTPKAIMSTLERLPTTIHTTYDQAMERIENMNEDYREMARVVLSWVALARRPLNVAEIQHAVVVLPEALEIDQDEIIDAETLSSMCAGLVTIECGMVFLVHYTAEEYFNETNGKWFPKGNKILARSCLTYLLFDAFGVGACSGKTKIGDFEHRKRDFPLLEYASSYWGSHLKADYDKDLESLALRLLERKPHLDSSVQALFYSNYSTTAVWNAENGSTALHVASFFGVHQVVNRLLLAGADVNAADSNGSTSLMYAAAEGHSSVVEKPIQEGGVINTLSRRETSALHLAILFERDQVVRILLSCRETDVNSRGTDQDNILPLTIAARQNCISIVRELLGRPELEVNKKFNRSALMVAAELGNNDVVSLLLADPRVLIDECDDQGSTSLHIAVCTARFNVVETLLDHGADTEAKDVFGEAPIFAAARKGLFTIFCLLVKYKADWKSRAVGKDNLLQYCSKYGDHHLIVRYILEELKALDIDARDSRGGVALHNAARFNCTKTIEVLLEFGARTDIRDKTGRTPLEVAEQEESLEAITLIHNTNTQHHESQGLAAGDTPLWTAARLGRMDLIQVAIDKAGVSPTIDLDRCGPHTQRNALWYAVDANDVQMITTLLEAGVSDNHKGQDGVSPLFLAIYRGHVEAITCLLEHGVDTDIEHAKWGKPLTFARRIWNWKIAVKLAQHGATIDLRSRDLQNLLATAAIDGNSEAVSRILASGADPQWKFIDGHNPISMARFHGHEHTAELLIEHAALKSPNTAPRAQSECKDRSSFHHESAANSFSPRA